MKCKLFILTALLALSQQSIAAPKPEKCPSPDAIKAVALTAVQQVSQGTWVVGIEDNRFDTNENWAFVMGYIDANDDTEAMGKAQDALPKLKSLSNEPMPHSNRWFCIYQAGRYRAGTVTPNTPDGNIKNMIDLH